MSRGPFRAALFALLTALTALDADAAAAQGVAAHGAAAELLLQRPARTTLQASPDMGSPLGPAALSFVLPGAGQYALGQGRTWVYAALEVVGWALFLERRSAGGDYRNRYRDFAWEQGRLQTGSRLDGDFDYYETLTQWTASGAYDSDPEGGGVQPETDPSTYNGSIWERATQIFILGGGPVPESDPAYQSALSYYDERAYRTAFLWDWSGTPGGREELGDLIRASDDRFRQATTALGFVIANHLVSAADAYLSARTGSALRLGAAPYVGMGGLAWRAALTVRVGR